MSSPAVEVGMSKRQYTCTVHWCCVHSPLTGFPQLCARRPSGGVPGFQEWFCILQKASIDSLCMRGHKWLVRNGAKQKQPTQAVCWLAGQHNHVICPLVCYHDSLHEIPSVQRMLCCSHRLKYPALSFVHTPHTLAHTYTGDHRWDMVQNYKLVVLGEGGVGKSGMLSSENLFYLVLFHRQQPVHM